ncbi:MAG: MBL fold metallo-hydrolase [Dehalococcoidia bacterium]
MSTVTIYGGANMIGGNKILLEDDDSRLFFDFGTTFKTRDLYFEEYLKPRPGAGLLDMLEMDLLPPLEGLYRPDFVPSGDVWARCHDRPGYRELERVDGVLVSHAHVDHTGYISFLREDVPIYASATTAFIAKAMQDSSMADFEKEVCYVTRRAPASDSGYLKPQRESYRQRPFCFADTPDLSPAAQEFWTRSPNHILGGDNKRRKGLEAAPFTTDSTTAGDLPVRFFPVDHSVHGAGAWAVETSAGWVVYSGDLRWHGSAAEETKRFIHEVASLRPRLLLCEGTRIPKEAEASELELTNYTEREVYDRALRVVQAEPGLVIADFGPRNIERLETFLQIAEQTRRKLVILPKDAYLLEAMRLVSASVPALSSSREMLLYQDLRYQVEPWDQNLRNQFGERLVSARHAHDSPGDYILCFSFWDAKNLIDINVHGGTYIYSSSEAYSEEQEQDFRRLREWLRHFDIGSVGLPHERRQSISKLPEEEQGLHSSGHASADDIMEFVREIGPRTVVPIHTENPGYFLEHLRNTDVEVAIREYGGSLTFG